MHFLPLLIGSLASTVVSNYETIEISRLAHFMYLPLSIQNIKNFIDFIQLSAITKLSIRQILNNAARQCMTWTSRIVVTGQLCTKFYKLNFYCYCFSLSVFFLSHVHSLLWPQDLVVAQDWGHFLCIVCSIFIIDGSFSH